MIKAFILCLLLVSLAFCAEGIPKKELCLLGCKAFKKDWQRQLCEIACNQIKESSDKFNFKKYMKKGLSIAKKLGKEYIKKQIPIPMSEAVPKKELCLIGCSMLKGWKKSLCEIACEQISSDSEFLGKKFKKSFGKAFKKGLSLGKKFMKLPGAEALIPGLGQIKGMSKLLKIKNLKDVKKQLKMLKGLKNLKGKDLKKLLKTKGLAFGKKFLKSKIPQLPLADKFPKKEACLIACNLLKGWKKSLCQIACEQIKDETSSDKAFNIKKLRKMMKGKKPAKKCKKMVKKMKKCKKPAKKHMKKCKKARRHMRKMNKKCKKPKKMMKKCKKAKKHVRKCKKAKKHVKKCKKAKKSAKKGKKPSKKQAKKLAKKMMKKMMKKNVKKPAKKVAKKPAKKIVKKL